KNQKSSPREMASSPISHGAKIEDATELCLECHAPLPPLLAHNDRPRGRCDKCGEILMPPGPYWKPSLDRCLDCGAALPHPLPTGERSFPHCHKCGAPLPPLAAPKLPSEGGSAAPEPREAGPAALKSDEAGLVAPPSGHPLSAGGEGQGEV